MKTLQPLPVSALYSHCDSEQFDFTTTETLEDIAVTTGQERNSRGQILTKFKGSAK
jgi:hypothetical protein